MSNTFDLVDLSRQLKQERLFVNCERDQLRQLNEEVSKTAENLYSLSWVTRKQKANLNDLVRAAKEVTPVSCCQKANALEKVKFIDGYKYLTYHESKIGECLKMLKQSPQLGAMLLMQAEKDGPESLQSTAQILMSGIYGNSVMQEDEILVLQVLKSLIELQILPHDNPRKLLRKESCAFSVFFKLLIEGLFSAKLFLTAALHKPVMQLLMEDEWFYDIDPERAVHRFPPQERNRRFGQPESPEYQQKLKIYRESQIKKLMVIAERFCNSIKGNMYCFPQSLSWTISQMYSTICKSDRVSSAEAKAMCTDLVLALFICPAICDPEPYGITTDAPISYIARHNLMQVAQILQVLAMSNLEDIDSRQRDLYEKFEKDSMGFLLRTVLDRTCSDQPPQISRQLQSIERTAMYMTMTELIKMLSFLRNSCSNWPDNLAERRLLQEILSNVPSTEKLDELQRKSTPNVSPNATPPGTPSSHRKNRVRGDRSMRLRVFLTPDRHNNDDSQSDQENDVVETKTEEVIVISLGVVNECPGMESEQKVLEQESRQKKARYNSLIPGEDNPISESEINVNEKRTRFSLSHDQDSIATSDNLEAISEAASSHSVGSDIENDNLSDMVSANVSGRGTPSISGRDTPLSQATCETDSQMEGQVEERRHRVGPDLPVNVQKPNREDVVDKFQKFDIKQDLESRDDIKSTVSDTWSTDVLASDSEPPEQNQLERLDEIAEEMVRQNLLGVQIQEASENIETASDAWSTDVLASDTSELQMERLRELEQEEVSSISSRSQLQDEPSDVGNPNSSEDTPQPSSPHSTCSDGRRPSEDLGAVGGDDSDTFNTEDYSDVFSFPETDTRQRGLNPRFTDQNPSRKPEKSKKYPAPSPPGPHGRNQPIANPQPGLDVKRNQFNHSSQGAFREVDHGVENLNNSLLDEFDPVVTSTSTKQRHGHCNQATTQSNNSVPNLEVPHSTNAAVMSWDSSGNSADSGLISMESSTNSIDSVSSQLSTGLKLTEQQNVNIDSNRLSAVVNVFDPLSQGGGSSDQGSQGDHSESSSGGGSVGTPPQVGGGTPEHMFPASATTQQKRENPFNRFSYNEQGARPKVATTNTSTTTSAGHNPKILLQLNDKEIRKLDNNNSITQQQYSNGKSPYSMVRFTQNGSVKSPTSSQELAVSFDGGESVDVKGSSVGSGLLVHVENDVVVVDHQKSNKMNGVAGKTDGVKNEDEAEDKSPKKKKSNPSFITTIKDKFSKGNLGTFQVGMSGMHRGTGNKKRLTKPPEKDDPNKGTAILVDIGGGGDAVTSPKGNLPRNESGEDMLTKYKPPAMETSDDILAKYRKPVNPPNKPQEIGSSNDPSSSSANRNKGKDDPDGDVNDENSPPAYDPSNLETCKAFVDAKKKVRLVLSNADFQAIPLSSSPSNSILGIGHGPAVSNDRKENELVAFLKAQLAEAINLQDKDLIAQLHETIRCLSVFNNHEIKKLLKSIREEHKNRSPYTSYLIRCRQGLLGTQAHLERLLNRVQRDKKVVNKYFLSVYVRMFLEKRERVLHKFIQEFQKISLSDEKTNFVEDFLTSLHKAMDNDAVWQVARRDQVEESKIFIERNVMSHIYTHAMYPNGDGDMHRDQILHEHIRKLAEIISPNHKDLRIPKMYHYECPWPAAQNEIYMINAYKTPKDKLQCVLRCSSTIMNLLSLANEKSVPAADDFMPVLIFVLIKANPPSLLSTVQYVNSFYEKRLQGEEHYWWMQFTSAIEFIKTMIYNN